MFEWYAQSSVCYVYLCDISLPKGSPHVLTTEDLSRSRWVSRGWTLQELIAPDHVRFFSDDWTECGNRRALATVIHQVTKINTEILERLPGSEELELLYSFNISTRMSWAAKRQTTRPEDRAYCLLGLFRVNMAMLYGEGGLRAFYRLQEEIMKRSTDQSILAWTPIQPEPSATTSVLADSPSAFSNGSRILSILGPGTFEMTNRGLRIAPRLFRDHGQLLVLLNCVYVDDPSGQLGIRINREEDDSGLSSSYLRVLQGPAIVSLKQLKEKKDTQGIPYINTSAYSNFRDTWGFEKARTGDVNKSFKALEADLSRSFDEIKKYIRFVETKSERDIYIAQVTNRISQVKDGNIYCSFELKSATEVSMTCPTISSDRIQTGKIYTITNQIRTEQKIDLYIAKLQTDEGPDTYLCKIGLSPKEYYSSELAVKSIECKCEDGYYYSSTYYCSSCGIDLRSINTTGMILSSRMYNTIEINLRVFNPPQEAAEPAPEKKSKLWDKLTRRH
jgi:hypothetical protein